MSYMLTVNSRNENTSIVGDIYEYLEDSKTIISIVSVSCLEIRKS